MERASMQLFALVSAMILFRAISQKEIGHWATFLTVITVVEVGRTGLLQNALIKYLSNANEKDYKAINTASLYLNVLVGILVAVSFLILSKPASDFFGVPALDSLFDLYAINTILLTPLLQFNFIQQANLDFKGILWSSVVRQLVLFAYVLIFFLFHLPITLSNLVIVRAVGIGLGGCVAWYFARGYLRFDKKVSWEWVVRLFNFGKYVMGTNLATMIYKGTDRVMIAKFFGDVQVAIFDSAVKITNLAEAPTFSMATILFPQSARVGRADGLSTKVLYEKAVGAILTILIPAIVLVLFFAEWIILFIAGESYLSAANILRVTMFYGIFIPFAVQFGTVLDSTGRPKTNFIFTVLSVFLNLVLNYFFIIRFGTIGAAYGTLLAYFLGFIAMQVYLYRTFGVVAFRASLYMITFYVLIANTLQNRLKRNKKV